MCIPIPGIFQRGRLYKAQSCSSIVRDKVQQPHIQTATTDRHSAVFTDKSRILRNCLGSRLLGSDSDINQNNGPAQSNVLLALNATKKKPTKGCIARASSPLHRHLDSSLCSSQCWYSDQFKGIDGMTSWMWFLFPSKIFFFFYKLFNRMMRLIIIYMNEGKNPFIVQYKNEMSKWFFLNIDNKRVLICYSKRKRAKKKLM